MVVPLMMTLTLLLAVGIMVAVRFGARRKLEPLAELFDGRSADVRGFLRLRLEGHIRGREAAFVAAPGSKHSPPKLCIRVSYGVPGSFRVAREGVGTRIAKSLHLQGDVDVGDAELDAKYVFACDDPTSFARWLREPGVREAMGALMDRKGGHALALRDGVLEATQVRPKAIDFEPDTARGTLASLEKLGAALTGGS